MRLGRPSLTRSSLARPRPAPRGPNGRAGGTLASLGLSPASPEQLTSEDVLDLQRTAGNGAVSELLQRQPTPIPTTAPTGAGKAAPTGTPTPTTGGTTTAAPAAAPNPLSDARIKWIEELPTTIKLSIDSVGDNKLKKRIYAIDESLTKQRAAIDTAKTDDDKKAATEKMASSADTRAKEQIDKVHGKTWAVKRLALMDYLGCTLGGDAGVERYYRSLVQFGGQELWIHPEAARRLAKVSDALAKEKPAIPMPNTTVGFGLRGRHVHPGKEDKQPGMMTHSLGVAIDWEAYKNVHLKDEQLMHLITAVTDRPHNLQLPADAMATIVALGEQSMGNKLTDKQAKQAEKGAALVEQVGKDFDLLEAASDKFRDSLTFKKEDLLALHRDIRSVQGPLEDAREQLKSTRNKKKREELQWRIATLEAEVAKKMADNRAKLETLFKPWLDALKKARQGTLDDAKPLLKGKDLNDVLTSVGLKSKEKTVAAGTQAIAKDLAGLAKQAAGSTKSLGAVRARIAGAQAYLAKSGSDEDKAAWTDRLAKLEGRAAAAVGRATAVATEAKVLRGGAPPGAPAKPAGKARKPKWAKEVAAWEAEVAKHETAVTTAEGGLKTATGKVPPAAVTEAFKLRDERAASEQIRAQVSKQEFAKLQALKVKLFHLDKASQRLLTDASFMFPKASVRDPGVAQLTGVLEENESGARADIGGGGFFGTARSAKEGAAKAAKENKPMPNKAGFGKRFFQMMVTYGFEPAAHWRTADSMHFQVRGLVEAIVPADACQEPAAGAEDKAKDDKEKAAIEQTREKAVKHRAAGQAYSAAAVDARAKWAAESAKP